MKNSEKREITELSVEALKAELKEKPISPERVSALINVIQVIDLVASEKD